MDEKIKMKMNKYLGIFLLGLFLVGLVSASGLTATIDVSSINKTYNHNAYVNVIISNDESFSFFNISMEENPYITISKIPILLSGETRNITALVKSNENINTSIKIYGYYLASLGESNKIHQIDITYDDGLSLCDFSIIKGERISWNNLENTETKTVRLKNIETGDYFQEIPANESRVQIFDIPLVLPFQFIDRTGFSRQSCNLVVLNDKGYINNPEYDTSINININVQYPLTTLELFTLNIDYNLSFYGTQEDIFSIKNIGNNIAKNIYLSADWFSFSQNNFDLEPGVSKNIGYTINPKIYHSNETDKDYTKELTITGNFITLKKDFNIFIKYAEIVTEEEQNTTSFKDWLCENFPEFCEPQVVYKYVDSGEAKFNVSYTENQVKSLYDIIFDFFDAQDIKDKQTIEANDNINLRLLIIENSTSGTSDNIDSISQKIATTNSAWMFAAWMLGMVVTGILLFILILKYKDKFKNNTWSRYG